MRVKTTKRCFGFIPRNRGFLKVSVLAGFIAGAALLLAVFIFMNQYGAIAPGSGRASDDPGILAHTANIITHAFGDMIGSSQGPKPVAVVSLERGDGDVHESVQPPASSDSAASTPPVRVLKKKISAKAGKKKSKVAAPAGEKLVESADKQIEAASGSSSLASSSESNIPEVAEANQKPKKAPPKSSKSQAAAPAPCGFYSASSPSHLLVINEIAWMGSLPRAYESSTLATGNEWIELKNISGQEVDVSGWRLMNQNGKIEAVFEEGKKVAPEGLLLLERTDDDTIPWIKADKIYTGSLSNSGDWLALYDGSCDKVDEVNALAGWTAGDRATKQTMERGRDLLWHTSVSPGGTPRLENTGGVQGSSGSPSTGSGNSGGGGGGVVLASYGGPTAGSGQGGPSAGSGQGGPSAGSGQGGTSVSPIVSLPQPASTTRVVLLITEVQTASASSTREEWVEIYNPTSTDITLAGWYMQKHTKGASSSFATFAPKELFANMTIKGLGYLIIAHPSSMVRFDIATDNGIAADNALALKNPEGDIVDLVGWGAVDSTSSPQGDRCEGACAPNASSGVSLARKYDGGAYIDTDNNALDFFLSLFPTPGTRNTTSSNTTPTSSSSTASSTSSQGPPGQTSTSTVTSTPDNSSSTPPIIDNSTSTPTSTLPVSTSTDLTTPTSSPPLVVTTSSPPLVDSTSSPPSANTTSTASTTITTNAPTHPVIFEVQTTGGPGNTTNDYIKILNPTSSTIDISNWKLRKRTSSGSESSVRVFPSTGSGQVSSGLAIVPGGYFVWANSTDGFADTLGANVSSTATIADDTSIALEDSTGAIIDALAWGSGQTNPFVEGSAFAQNPSASSGQAQKLVRKTDSATGFVIDTDNNSADFELR